MLRFPVTYSTHGRKIHRSVRCGFLSGISSPNKTSSIFLSGLMFTISRICENNIYNKRNACKMQLVKYIQIQHIKIVRLFLATLPNLCWSMYVSRIFECKIGLLSLQESVFRLRIHFMFIMKKCTEIILRNRSS